MLSWQPPPPPPPALVRQADAEAIQAYAMKHLHFDADSEVTLDGRRQPLAEVQKLDPPAKLVWLDVAPDGLILHMAFESRK